jgi:heat shock protein HslJ
MRGWWFFAVATLALTGCTSRESIEVPSAWRMVRGDAGDEPLDLSESQFTLVIENAMARGEAPCNCYSFPIEINGSEISFGLGEQSLIECLGEQADLERLYFTSLGQSTSYTVDGTTLTLKASGAVWVFEADS